MARAGARAARALYCYLILINFLQRLVFFCAIFGRELGSPGKDFYVFGDVFRFFPGLASSWLALFQVSGSPVFPGIFRAFFAPAIDNLLQRDGGHKGRHTHT